MLRAKIVHALCLVGFTFVLVLAIVIRLLGFRLPKRIEECLPDFEMFR